MKPGYSKKWKRIVLDHPRNREKLLSSLIKRQEYIELEEDGEIRKFRIYRMAGMAVDYDNPVDLKEKKE